MFFNHGRTRTGFANARPNLERRKRKRRASVLVSGSNNHGLHGLASLTFAIFGMAWVAVAAEPTISVEARQRYPWNGLVDLGFTITGTSGTKYDTSFTAKDMIGNTNIAMRTIRKADGSAANVAKEQLTPGTYNWVWDAAADLPKDWKCDRVTVTGTAVEHKYLYMVIDLSSGSSSSKYPVSYLDAVPSGGWGDTYKGNKLVLRRVSKGSNSVAGSMTSDMWVGVFEVTQLQYKNVKGQKPSGYLGNYRPVESAGYSNCKDFLTKISSRTGHTFRMPTRDEWRYACRAGSTKNPFSATTSTARYSATANDGKGGYSTQHTKVGSYSANNWGIYDMLGNVGEWTSTKVGVDKDQEYILGGSYASGTPTDETWGYFGGGSEEGFRVFGVVQ